MAVVLVSCTENHQAATPRPRSYYRPVPADTTVALWTDNVNKWSHNTEAIATAAKPGWLTVAYPRRGMSLYITFTHAKGDELADARANRMERLLLNSGSGSSVEQEFANPAGWQIFVMKTQSLTTPIQFLATNAEDCLVSGSLQVNKPGIEDYEAIRPDVELITRDIYTSLGQLGQ